MDNIQVTPRNKAIGSLADLLKSGKTFANKYQIPQQVPLVGGTGIGDLFMGKAPELVDDVSYDGLQAAIRGGNLATGGIGTYGARPAVADAALLGMDIAGVGKGLGGLSRKSAGAIYDKLLEGGTSLSRRDALKKLGAIAGSTAIAGTGVGALRKLSDNAVSEAVHAAPKVADNVAVAAAKKYKFNSLAEYLKDARDTAELMSSQFYGNKEWAGATDHSRQAWDQQYNKELKRLLKDDEVLYKNHKESVLAGQEPAPWSVQHNPQTNKYESLYADEVLSPQAKQEMKAFKTNTQGLHETFGDPRPYDWAQWMANSSNNPEAINNIVTGTF